jgi:tyrosyl-tRNA synthetase
MQSSKIMRFDGENPVKILYNGDWLNKLALVDILNIAQHFSVQQLIERDMFQERIKKNESINLREFLYPLLQGYDSVAMEVDLELGGSDQTFNMLCGRTLVGAILNKEKFVMTVPLLTDSKGTKIGKTEGNVIGITDEPVDFYAKIMALGDDAIIPCLRLLTDMPEEEIAHVDQKIAAGENPMVFKKQLALLLTAQLNTETDAQRAQSEFEKRSQTNTLTEADLPTIAVSDIPAGLPAVDFIMALGVVSSKSEVKRLLGERAIDINGTVLENSKTTITPRSGDIIKIGKKIYRKLI